MHPPRLPVPHLFMGLSAGILALLTLAAVSEAGGGTISASLAFPALLGVTVRAGRPGADGHGRPLLGLGAGLLTGLAGASILVGLDVLPSGGPQWVYLPLLFATLGTMLGVAVPARRPTDGAGVIDHLPELSGHPKRPDLDMTC
jgi:hypothetical protein